MIYKNKILIPIVFILLFLMLFAPAELMNIKMALTVILLGVIIIYIYIKNKEVKISKNVLLWFIIYITMSILATAISIIYNNPGATNFITINIVNPIIYLLFIIGVSNCGYFYSIEKYMLIGTISIVLYNLIFTITINIFPSLGRGVFPFIVENLGGLELGFTKFTSENITVLTFLVPFAWALYFIEEKGYKKRIALNISILGALSAIFSARTAFMVALAVTPIIILVLGHMTRRSNHLIKSKNIFKGIFILIILLLSLIFIFKIDFNLILEKISHSFNINSKSIVNDNGGYLRAQQFKALIATWELKPILGWGDGANALNNVRSNVEGLYELSYIAILMQRGIIGFTVYCIQILWIYSKLIKIVKANNDLSKLSFCTIVGFTTILIANATNPYLYSFDRLFIFFYPMLIIQYNEIKLRFNSRETII